MPDRLKQIARASVENGGRRAPRNEQRQGGASGFGSVDIRKEQDTKKVLLKNLKYFYNIFEIL